MASSRKSKRWAVEELVAESAVERFDPGVLPQAAPVDEHGVGAAEAAPVRHGVGDELGPVIEAHVGRCASHGGQTFEAGHHAVGIDGTLIIDGQGFTAVLVDDVQEFEVPPLRYLVELEVEGPDYAGP